MSKLLLVNATPAAYTCRLEPWPVELTLPAGAELHFEQDLTAETDYLELDLSSSSFLTLFGIDRSTARLELGEAQLLLYPPSTFRRDQPPRLRPPSFAGMDQSGLIVLAVDRRSDQARIHQDDSHTVGLGGAQWLGFPGQPGSNQITIVSDGVRVSDQTVLASVEGDLSTED